MSPAIAQHKSQKPNTYDSREASSIPHKSKTPVRTGEGLSPGFNVRIARSHELSRFEALQN